MPSDTTETVAEHSTRLKPSINLHAPLCSSYSLYVQLPWYPMYYPGWALERNYIQSGPSPRYQWPDVIYRQLRASKILVWHWTRNFSLCKHVSNICKTSHYRIRALWHIRQSVDFETTKTIGCAIVGSSLDYCNSILYRTTAGNLKKLQTVQNALARAVSGKRKYNRITPTLIYLHWLPVAHRINFKIVTIVYKTKIHHQPEYLDNLLVKYENTQIICRRIPCRSPHSNCSCNSGFLCSCSKTVEHYSNRHQKQFIVSHIQIQTKNISFPPSICIIVTCMPHAWDSISLSDCWRVIKLNIIIIIIIRLG